MMLLGLLGLMQYFRDFIRLPVSLEILMLANIILLVVIAYTGGVSAREEALAVVPLLLAVAASYAAVGLGILVTAYRHKGTVRLEKLQRLRG
jgi:NADH:ubiquinone oxidoreductase subunit K